MLLIIAKDIEERRRALEGALKKEKAPHLFFDSESFDSFLQEVETLPFLSQKKGIILQQVDQLNRGTLDQLHAYIDKPSPWISLYLTAASITSLRSLAKKAEQVIHVKDEKPWEREKRLAEWASEKAAAAGVVISSPTAHAFVKAVDSKQLERELEKLICFVGEKREITLEAIHAVSTPIYHETLWQLGEAIFTRQSGLAIQIGERLLDEGMALFPLLAHLRTQFHTTLKILAAFQQGGREAVTKAFPYLKGGLLEKKISVSQSYGVTRLQQGLIGLFETELKAKNSSTQPLLLLEILLVKVTHDTLSTAECSRSY